MTDHRSISAVESARDAVVNLMTVQGLAAGDRLPSERQLAHDLRVSRTTLREALAQLARTGCVVRRPGRGGGTFISQPKIERDLTALRSLPEHLRRQGHESSARVLATRVMSADRRTATELGVVEGDVIYEVTRLRLSDGEPISLERGRFPALRFPGLLERPLGGSIFTLLQEVYGVPPHRARERIEPVAAGPIEADALGVAVGAPLLSIDRVTYDREGQAVEFGRDLFRGDRTRVVVWVEPGPKQTEEWPPVRAAHEANSMSLGQPAHEHLSEIRAVESA